MTTCCFGIIAVQTGLVQRQASICVSAQLTRCLSLLLPHSQPQALCSSCLHLSTHHVCQKRMWVQHLCDLVPWELLIHSMLPCSCRCQVKTKQADSCFMLMEMFLPAVEAGMPVCQKLSLGRAGSLVPAWGCNNPTSCF